MFFISTKNRQYASNMHANKHLVNSENQGRNYVLNIGGDQFLYRLYIYALIDARTHIITRTQRLVNTTPRLLL